MFTITVINNDNTEKVLSFSDFARKVVIAKYNQLVSQGDIQDFIVSGTH